MLKEKGFSLIEIMIVLGIVASLAVFASSRKKNPQKEFNRFFRRFSLMSKKIRNQALIDDATYRMIFYLEDGAAPTVWVEKTTKNILLGDEKESREKFKKILKNLKENKKIKSKDKKKTKDSEGFKKAGRFDFNKLKMPRALTVKQVEISGIDYAIDDGLAIFHYFPHGLVEETAIQFQALNGAYKTTLISDSISGEIYNIKGHKSLKELQER